MKSSFGSENFILKERSYKRSKESVSNEFGISVSELERMVPCSSASWPLSALAGRARQGGVWSPVTLTHSHKTSREKHMRTK